MKDVVVKFFKPGELVVRLFSGTFATAEACLELSRHHLFVSCKIDSECFAACKKALVEMYARKVLTENFAFPCPDEIVHACMMVV